jgi:hypothetical protein
MLGGLIGHKRRVVTSGNYSYTTAAEIPRDGVCPWCIGGHEGNADQIYIGIYIQRFDILIANMDLMSRRCQACDGCQRQKAENACVVEVQKMPLDSRLVVEGAEESRESFIVFILGRLNPSFAERAGF